MAWNPFGVQLELSASGSNVTRTSATQFTVKVAAHWETYYSGASTNYGMKVTSGGKTIYMPKFSGNSASSGDGSFTGTYSISGNGSQTKTISVTFENYNDLGDSKTTTVTFNVNVPAWTSYAISYNANGGSGVPSSQTKWKDQTLTLSSTKPTRTGYTFSKWNTKSDGSGTSYSAGANYTANSAATLYAIWTENKLTINYYSNYATSYAGTATALNTVGASKNVLVYTQYIYYDNDYSTYGLANYSNSSGSLYMTRTGYTGTGDWGTSTGGGTLINENTGYATGQAIAAALGKTLVSGDASINLYAQWTENKLTVNYYSNYADYGTYKGEALSVSNNTNVKVHSQDFYYDNSYNSGLSNVQNQDYLYLSRIGYTPTGYWMTTNTDPYLVHEDTSFTTGQSLAEALGKDISNVNASVILLPQWQINTYRIAYNANGGVGNMSFQFVNWQETFTLPKNTFTREGYKFIGWNLYRNQDSKWYVAGQGWLTEEEIIAGGYSKRLYENQIELTLNNSWINGCELALAFTMYAIWEISGVVYIDNGVTFEPYLTYIDNGTSWDLYLAYVDDGTNWTIIS